MPTLPLMLVTNGIIAGWAARHHPPFALGYLAVFLWLLYFLSVLGKIGWRKPIDVRWPTVVILIAAAITYVVDWLLRRRAQRTASVT